MLTELQKSKLPNMFNMFDANNNGYIEKGDFERIISECSKRKGWQTGDAPYQEFCGNFLGLWLGMMALADKDQNDHLTLDEFLNYFDNLIQNPDSYQRVAIGLNYGVFGTFDSDNDGVLSAAEYEDFYVAMGLDVNFARQVYGRLDLNGDSGITLDELSMLVDQFLKSDDPNAPGNVFFGPIA